MKNLFILPSIVWIYTLQTRDKSSLICTKNLSICPAVQISGAGGVHGPVRVRGVAAGVMQGGVRAARALLLAPGALLARRARLPGLPRPLLLLLRLLHLHET